MDLDCMVNILSISILYTAVEEVFYEAKQNTIIGHRYKWNTSQNLIIGNSPWSNNLLHELRINQLQF